MECPLEHLGGHSFLVYCFLHVLPWTDYGSFVGPVVGPWFKPEFYLSWLSIISVLLHRAFSWFLSVSWFHSYWTPCLYLVFLFALSLHCIIADLDCLPGFDPCMLPCTCLWILLLIKPAFGSPLSMFHVQFHETYHQ